MGICDSTQEQCTEPQPCEDAPTPEPEQTEETETLKAFEVTCESTAAECTEPVEITEAETPAQPIFSPTDEPQELKTFEVMCDSTQEQCTTPVEVTSITTDKQRSMDESDLGEFSEVEPEHLDRADSEVVQQPAVDPEMAGPDELDRADTGLVPENALEVNLIQQIKEVSAEDEASMLRLAHAFQNWEKSSKL